MTASHNTPFTADDALQQLKTLRDAVLARRAVQRGGAASRVAAATEQLRDSAEDTHAQAMTERELNFSLEDHEATELAAIDAALARLKLGTYGECIDCGINIPAARLRAQPEAARCIPCQEAAEKQA